ncbi:thymidylate kinase [Leucobacter luti]|nr:dTMP kinase [Leucobacter luti]TCK34277.1 thymidylate kinase [Leucobacter luti]
MSDTVETSPTALHAAPPQGAAEQPSNGIFITFEGGDGAGKTTQAELLSAWFIAQGREVVRTREPGGTPLGVEVRRLLLHGGEEIGAVDPRAEALLYAADRAQHVATVVRPALARGAIVVQDRYIDSSLAYQGAGRVLDVAEVRGLSEWAVEGLWPTLTVLLDLDPTLAAERRTARGGTADRLEAEAETFHRAVRDGFLALADAEPERYLVLDAALPFGELHAAIAARVSLLTNLTGAKQHGASASADGVGASASDSADGGTSSDITAPAQPADES